MKTLPPLWIPVKRSRSATTPGRELAKRIRRKKLSLDQLANMLDVALQQAAEEGRDDERECQRIIEERKHPSRCQ